MKSNIFLFCISSLIILGACKKTVSTETVKSVKTNYVKPSQSSSESHKVIPGCPEGMHAVLSYEFAEFHFHRPKFDCESGFWFCTVGGHWEVDCVPDRPLASINGTTAYVWAQELENGQIEIHFPIGLKDTNGYTAEDLSIFNVDEEYEIYKGITLKTGDYPVVETDVDFVTVVDTL
jgi:hypothetical protein